MIFSGSMYTTLETMFSMAALLQVPRMTALLLANQRLRWAGLQGTEVASCAYQSQRSDLATITFLAIQHWLIMLWSFLVCH